MKMTDKTLVRLARRLRENAAYFRKKMAPMRSSVAIEYEEAADAIERAYQQGALDMRERCAKACEAPAKEADPYCCQPLAEEIATAIRSLTVGET